MAQNVEASSDSQLVVRQVNGEYEAKKASMAAYLAKVKEVASTFNHFGLHHVLRDQNTKADTLSKLVTAELNDLDHSVYTEILTHPSVGATAAAVLPAASEPSWIDPIWAFLHAGQLPLDKKEARRIQSKANHYVVEGAVLYKKSFTFPLLRCLRPSEAIKAITDVHEGICGAHQGGRVLSHKILRQGYYWPTMRQDCINYVRKCAKCQIYAPVSHLPAAPLRSIEAAPLPFTTWGMDIMGPFPPARYQRRFVVVAVDYFTKWAEAEALSTIPESAIRTFFIKSVVYRYGLPRVLITDNGKQFDNKAFAGFCAEHRIDHRRGAVKHPQTNGQTEATNKILLKGIKARLDRAKGRWLDELPHILWADRTTPKTATGETPFRLAFGTEAVIPLEVQMSSHRVANYDPDTNDSGLRANLDLLDEVRDQARIRIATSQQHAAKYYNQRVRPRSFKIGDLVLRRTIASDPTNQGKLAPNWEGPYRITQALDTGSYHLVDMDGTALPRAWNAEHLRPFYQ